MSFIFVSSPYTHADPKVVEHRYEKVLEFTARKINEGFVIYSPIVHCHPLAAKFDLPKEFAFWEHFDKAMIDACQELWVLALDGWHESTGVEMEVQHARNIGKPIAFRFME
jgi:hypothetical protein